MVKYLDSTTPAAVTATKFKKSLLMPDPDYKTAFENLCARIIDTLRQTRERSIYEAHDRITIHGRKNELETDLLGHKNNCSCVVITEEIYVNPLVSPNS